MAESIKVLPLEFDDGKEVECAIEGVFESEGQDYIALIPDNDSGDVYIYKYIEDEGDDYHFEDETDEEKFKNAVLKFEALKGHKRKED